jgi:hypothetical protein
MGLRHAQGASKGDSDSMAQWTLLCQTFAGPSHASAAKQAKDFLVQTTRMKDWYVVTGETESNLYYGFYHSYNDPKDKDTARAQRDKKAIAEVLDASGKKPFQSAIFQPLSGVDPTAPPEWDLKNAKGYFSWEIGVYMDSPDRKQAAVDAVREARKMGIEAYYSHGPTKSSVCIGAWPKEAVRAQEADAAKSSDPNTPVLVTTEPLPSGMAKGLRLKESDEKVKTMMPRFEPIDPKLVEVMKTYPYHSINGERAIRRVTGPDGQVSEVEDRAFPVLVPAKEEQFAEDPTIRRQAEQLGVVQPRANTPRKGAGQLKSIQDN